MENDTGPVDIEIIEQLNSMGPSEDGQDVLINLTIDGRDRFLAIAHKDALPAALRLLATERACRKICETHAVTAPLLPVSTWQVGLSENGKAILRIIMVDQTELAFAFPQETLPGLIAGLFTAARGLTEVTPQATTA